MIGVTLNAAGLLIGGIIGLRKNKTISPSDEAFLKLLMGVGTVFAGLYLAWKSFNGSAGAVFKQFGIVILAMIIGNIAGKLLRLQRMSNAMGQWAGQKLSEASAKGTGSFNDGFRVTALLACISPLAFLASAQEGLYGFSPAFLVKAAMDGLAAMSFVTVFGRGVLWAAIPVFAWQGTWVLLASKAAPFLRDHGLLDSVGATTGLLILSVSLVILNLKKIEMTNYLPSLAIAPLITWWWQ